MEIYQSKYCKEVIDFMSQGHTLYAYAGHIEVPYDTVKNWVQSYKEFFKAVEIGKQKSALWWETQLIESTTNKKISPQVVMFGVKNRGALEWKEKIFNDHSASDGTVSLNIEFEKSANAKD